MKTTDFLKQLRRDEIVSAIHSAEKKTSGEIRVFVSHKDVADPVAAAQTEFTRLGMTKTRQRNGVLIFVAPASRKFAVVGDEAVHQRCGDGFWRAMASEMTTHFKQADYTQGIIQSVHKAGALLAQHFPSGPDDTNELPDKIEQD